MSMGYRRFRIGVRLDGPMTNFIPLFIHYHNNIHGTEASVTQMRTPDLSELLSIGKEDLATRVDDFFRSDYSKELKPLMGSREAVGYASLNSEVVAMNVRTPSGYSEGRQFLNDKFPNCFSRMEKTPDHYLGGGGLTPPEVCEKYGLDFIIEDNPDIAKQCLDVGTRVIMLDRTWNRDVSLPGDKKSTFFGWLNHAARPIKRVESWLDLRNHMNLLNSLPR